MASWFKCFKPFVGKNKARTSPFLDLDKSKYQYSYSEEYLGAEGKVTCLEKSTEIHMSFSVRDGILVKIKRIQPYHVLFDYVDGAYYTNNETTAEYKQLVNAFSMLKEKSKNYDYLEIYEELEQIIYNFIVIHF